MRISAMPFLVLAMVSGAAVAQDHKGAGDIVVTGQKLPEKKAAEQFVGAITVTSNTQIARFHQPVCPVVIGLPADYAATIASRIRADAGAAGVEVAKKARCAPNLILIVAADGAKFVSDVRNTRPGWLEGLSSDEIRALAKPAAARAWTVATLRNEDGMRLSTPPEGSGAVGDPLSGKPTLLIKTASIIKVPERQDMEASFIVVDEAATVGLTLNQLADYTAMRGLARTRSVGADGAVGTILSIFDPAGTASRPRGLTQGDALYLKSLYESPGTSSAVSERNRIARRLAGAK